jgi:hypothetical protein
VEVVESGADDVVVAIGGADVAIRGAGTPELVVNGGAVVDVGPSCSESVGSEPGLLRTSAWGSPPATPLAWSSVVGPLRRPASTAIATRLSAPRHPVARPRSRALCLRTGRSTIECRSVGERARRLSRRVALPSVAGTQWRRHHPDGPMTVSRRPNPSGRGQVASPPMISVGLLLTRLRSFGSRLCSTPVPRSRHSDGAGLLVAPGLRRQEHRRRPG